MEPKGDGFLGCLGVSGLFQANMASGEVKHKRMTIKSVSNKLLDIVYITIRLFRLKEAQTEAVEACQRGRGLENKGG